MVNDMKGARGTIRTNTKGGKRGGIYYRCWAARKVTASRTKAYRGDQKLVWARVGGARNEMEAETGDAQITKKIGVTRRGHHARGDGGEA